MGFEIHLIKIHTRDTVKILSHPVFIYEMLQLPD